MKAMIIIIGGLLLSGRVYADTIELNIRIEIAGLEIRDREQGARIELPGYTASAAPGLPALPAKVIRLGLPPGADSSSLTFEVTDVTAPVEIPLNGRSLETGHNDNASLAQFFYDFRCADMPYLCPGVSGISHYFDLLARHADRVLPNLVQRNRKKGH